MKFTVQIDDEGLLNYIGRVEKRLQSNTANAVKDNVKLYAATARHLAPLQQGYLRAGLQLGTVHNKSDIKEGIIYWLELNKRRERTFEESRWNGRFLEWMHNSPKARNHFQTGSPIFMYDALRQTRPRMYKHFVDAVDFAINEK